MPSICIRNTEFTPIATLKMEFTCRLVHSVLVFSSRLVTPSQTVLEMFTWFSRTGSALKGLYGRRFHLLIHTSSKI